MRLCRSSGRYPQHQFERTCLGTRGPTNERGQCGRVETTLSTPRFGEGFLVKSLGCVPRTAGLHCADTLAVCKLSACGCRVGGFDRVAGSAFQAVSPTGTPSCYGAAAPSALKRDVRPEDYQHWATTNMEAALQVTTYRERDFHGELWLPTVKVEPQEFSCLLSESLGAPLARHRQCANCGAAI